VGSLVGVSALRIEIFWWAGCPSTDAARDLVVDALACLGLCDDVAGIAIVEVATDEQALELGFRGSPTIRIDGADVVELVGGVDPGADDPAALTCRLYVRRDGRISPTPDPADVHEAISIAAQAHQLTKEAA